ncbi:dihydrodipicolinate synthase [Sphaerosporella brunnea]|uniref:Dihydrodipicolinate synthase n=1 Tax=Sphaerosporella brunnea TaxID=1250544 RepID=A0A5J5EJF8_9PEZI|nr:dihydrodipicolinate synthase [Sphaerosporella brunnea]
MAAAAPPHGIWVPVPTFFARKAAADYSPVSPPLDPDTQLSHAVFLANAGVRGLVLLGSTGEAVHVTRAERVALVKHLREGLAAAGFPAFPLMAGTAANSVDETAALLAASKEAGADYGLVLAPSYFAGVTSQEGVVAWFAAVAARSPMPILIYHYPGVSNNLKITPATVRTLAAHPNIVGAKFSHGDISAHCQVALDPAIDHERFALFTGLGQHLFPAVQVGVAGAIDGLAAFYPASMVRLFELASADEMGSKQREEARRIQWAASRAEELVVGCGVVGIKEAVARVCGFGDADGTRLPLLGGLGDQEWKRWEPVMAEMERVEKAVRSGGPLYSSLDGP